MAATKVIPEEVRNVLRTIEVDGTVATITAGQLDRKLYVATDMVLKALGGKWNRKLGGHVFAENPAEAIELAAITGEYTNLTRELEQFVTPEPLAAAVVGAADIQPGMRVLEPSAGDGALVRAVYNLAGAGVSIAAIEQDEKMFARLIGTIKSLEGGTCGPGINASVQCSDFLNCDPDLAYQYDRVVMNPPFRPQVEHVTHAYRFLKPGGRLVAIMSAGVEFRQDRKYRAFRELVGAASGEIFRNPDDSFRASGTLVRTVTVILDKPRD